jgi:membrane-associated protease RseP (regulator of RpoE activity)
MSELENRSILNDRATDAYPAELKSPLDSRLDPYEVAEQVRAVVGRDFSIESIQVPRDPRRNVVVVLHGRLLRPSHAVFPTWLSELNRMGYTPFLRRATNDAKNDAVALHIAAGVMQRSNPSVWINIALMIATIISTLWVGVTQSITSLDSDTLWRLDTWLQGAPFAATLLGILAAHEFGHYFAARYHKIAVTLPFFLPLPIGFGTLGAFIMMREPVPDRRKLFDIGVAGPLAGLALALPLLFVGLMTSPVEVVPRGMPGWLEGNSILYYFAKILVHGKALPDLLTREDILMNQVLHGAWFGLLVTAINLLPVGQLDGGHVVYALFGERARVINIATLAAMALLAIAGLPNVQELFPFLESVGFLGWFLWLGLILMVIGPHHPPGLDDITELDPRRRLVGYLAILIFIVTFVPAPIRPIF